MYEPQVFPPLFLPAPPWRLAFTDFGFDQVMDVIERSSRRIYRPEDAEQADRQIRIMKALCQTFGDARVVEAGFGHELDEGPPAVGERVVGEPSYCLVQFLVGGRDFFEKECRTIPLGNTVGPHQRDQVRQIDACAPAPDELPIGLVAHIGVAVR